MKRARQTTPVVRGMVRAALLLGLAAAAIAEPLSPPRQREILQEALGAYDRAISAARENPAQASELYRQAAAGFAALVEAGTHNSALEYNLGNTYYRLGDVGRAVLHYRRAQALDPTDERLAANLRYVRDHVEPAIAPSGQSALAHQLLFLHYTTSLQQRCAWLVVTVALGYGLLCAWLRWRRRGLLLGGLIGAALALSFGLSLSWELQERGTRPAAVVVTGQPFLRYDRDETSGTNLVLKQPLGPGVELRILQQRGDWVEVQLLNDQKGWLPAAAVERV
jgi:tetratricopeptide (TPR) repeat protein